MATRLEIAAGDITRLPVDAIVNAANEALAPGGGVCGAIHRAAGPELAEACAALGGCATGSAKATPGFALPARLVIHAVGPVWRGGDQDEPALLAGCYRSALDLARAEAARSIAFPAISTGIYGYPLGAATAVAVATVKAWTDSNDALDRVVFSVFGDDVEAAYVAALDRD